jgi:hypothetical protein
MTICKPSAKNVMPKAFASLYHEKLILKGEITEMLKMLDHYNSRCYNNSIAILNIEE